jgi:flagellar L-ring protein precursor FlgH
VKRASNSLYFAFVMISFSGCAQLMGSLRRDLDDGDTYAGNSPTVGGRFAEHGFLSEDMPEGGSGGAVGHADRNPASGSSSTPGSRSWLTQDHADANRRDAARGEDDGQPSSDSAQTMDPAVRRQYKNGARATRADFVDESQNEGSLWASDGQTNYYFTKNKIRGVGDIITINLEQGMVSDVAVEARRTLSPRERDFELMAAQERLRMKAMGIAPPEAGKDQVASAAAAPARTPAASPSGAPAAEVDVPVATFADVDVSKSLELKAGDQMMGEIIERYPNGNYKVRATKKVPYKGGPSRMVTMIGVVKGTDIAEDDTVASGKLYEYRVEANR